MVNPIINVGNPYDIKTTVQYNELAGVMMLKSSQDVQPILQACQQEVSDFTRFGDGMHKAASIPFDLINEYYYRTGVNLMKKENINHLRQLINEGDFKAFKTIPGKL